MRKKIELEYIFTSSVKVLFSRLSTPEGLAEWFADDVTQKGDTFNFVWNKTDHEATVVECKPHSKIYFKWKDAEDEDEYFGFVIKVEPLTEEVALLVTDFADEDEVEDSIDIWDKQMESLHSNLGA